jgi:malonyl-CoA decarboxylase
MAMRLRSLLRAAGRMPPRDERRLRDLLHEIARAPRGDQVLPARLCASLTSAYEELKQPGRLAFLSILSRQDADVEAVRRCCQVLASFDEQQPRGAGALLRARSDLREALLPAHERIIERLAQQPDGLRFLVSLRADLLAAMAENRSPADVAVAAVPGTAPPPSVGGAASVPVMEEDGERERWRELDASLRRQLSIWFDMGLLRLERLTWEHTPAALLERIMAYERVHPFSGWDDLRTRLDGPHRRLFAFLHPRLPGEPLVFVQVALVSHVPTRLRDVLPRGLPLSPRTARGSPAEAGATEVGLTPRVDERPACKCSPRRRVPSPQVGLTPRVACFYTISSPHTGLRGVPIGGLLIKHVLSSLAASEPALDTFVTLSPVPGFRSWLEARLARHVAAQDGAAGRRTHDGASTLADEVAADEAVALNALLEALRAAGLVSSDPFEAVGPVHEDCEGDAASLALVAVRRALLCLCARYLCLATHRQRALDPVAAFHLRNGATLVSIHWGANSSARGVRESCSMMVNYLYEPESIEVNHSAYVSSGKIAASDSVWALAKVGGDGDHAGVG